MGWKDDVLDIGLSALSEVPGGGALVRLLDKWENDARLERAEADIRNLLKTIGRDGRTLDAYIQDAIRIAAGAGVTETFELRKADSCFAIVRVLNTRSQLGQEWDPSLHRDDAVAVIRNLVAVPDPVAELRAVVFELKRADLILVSDNCNAPAGLPWEAIGPNHYFFSRTDAIFQPWSPNAGAKEICRRAKGERAFNSADLDNALGWGPRRFNSATTYAQLRGWIEVPYDSAGGGPYSLPFAHLTEEGEFFLDH